MNFTVCDCKLTAFVKVGKWGIAIVDYEKRFLFSRFWHMTGEHRLTSYARTFFRMGKGKRIGKRLHNMVMGVSGMKMPLDHKNGNGLDCRSANLRSASQRLNNKNTKSRRNATSKYLGVSWTIAGQRRARWHAQIQVDQKKKHLGFFHEEIDAAIAYNYAAAFCFGEFARINRIVEYAHD